MLDDVSGVIVIDKPPGVTSAKVVALLKRLVRAKKVGHAGTLDPFATGVLVCCLNRATRLAQFFLHDKKKYRAVLRLGVETDTQDATGEIIGTSDPVDVSADRIHSVFRQFQGESMQRPPVHSALKQNGVRLYKLARQGKPVQKPARKIRIDSMNILGIQLPDIQFEVECSAGTYIRSLCSDIGAALGCGGHLKDLRRLESSGFGLAEAMTLEQVSERIESGDLVKHVISMANAVRGMPILEAGIGLKDKIHFGRSLADSDFPSDGAGLTDGHVAIVDENGHLLTVLMINRTLNHYKYCCVFGSQH